MGSVANWPARAPPALPRAPHCAGSLLGRWQVARHNSSTHPDHQVGGQQSGEVTPRPRHIGATGEISSRAASAPRCHPIAKPAFHADGTLLRHNVLASAKPTPSACAIFRRSDRARAHPSAYRSHPRADQPVKVRGTSLGRFEDRVGVSGKLAPDMAGLNVAVGTPSRKDPRYAPLRDYLARGHRSEENMSEL